MNVQVLIGKALDHARIVVVAATLGVFAAGASAQTAYVTASATDRVAVLDTASATATGSITVGDSPSAVEISRDGTRAYVSNVAADSVSVIDTASGAVVSTIAVGDQPGSLAVSPDGGHVYVLLSNGVVDVVDTALGSVVASIATGGSYGQLAITPDGSRVYVASGAVSVIDTSSNSVIASITTGTGAVGIAISPDGSRAYVSTYTYYFNPVFSAGGDVSIVDTATNSVVGNVHTYSLPASIAVSHDGSRAYVSLTATWSNTGYGAGLLPGKVVATIDTNASSIVGWTVLANTPAGLAVTPDDAQVYVAVPSSSHVAVIDAATATVATTIPVASTPGDVAIEPQLTDTTSYCTAGVTTHGCSAHISAFGHASASAPSGFEISVANVEGQHSGLIFYGVTGPSALPWGSGSSFVCVKAPTQRTPSQFSNGTDGACDGALSIDFNTYLATHSTALGQPLTTATTFWSQAWFRDPPASKGTNLSDALEFVVEP